MDATPNELARRALPVRRQAQIVLLIASAAAVVLLLGWGASRLGAAQPPAPPADTVASNDVRLSAAQLSTLTIKPVEMVNFRSEEPADGRIGLNSDTATQVFSPYSGRVIRVIAGIGEHVRRGAPLFSIEASEFAQSQSDLLNAASQLKLARIGEARRHAAYDSNGGSLQDWQLAQAELVGAQTALDAVRNRLRIFGLSAEQIAALERAKAPDPVTYVLAPIDGVVT